MKRFDVILPTYNNREELRAALAALARQTGPPFRVLVCVDGSTDGTQAMLAASQWPFPLEVLTHAGGRNHGRNATRNLALGHIEADYLLLLDTDFRARPGLLAAHQSLLEAPGGPCLSQGRIAYTNAGENPWTAYVSKRGERRQAAAGQRLPPFALTTGNLALPAWVFTQLGGQDASMRTYGGGDSEFGCRIGRELDVPLRANPAAVAEGELDKPLAEALRQMEEFGAINLRYLARAYPEYPRAFRLDLLAGRSAGGRAFRALLRPELAGLAQWIATQPLPAGLRYRAMGYLVAYHRFQGYRNGLSGLDAALHRRLSQWHNAGEALNLSASERAQLTR